MSDECLFCRIATRTIQAQIVAEEQEVLAFWDLKPQAPTHLLIIPKAHIGGLPDVTPAHHTVLTSAILMATRLAKERGLEKTGYRLVANVGPHGGQSVFHLHWHLLGGRQMQWPPG